MIALAFLLIWLAAIFHSYIGILEIGIPSRQKNGLALI